MSLGGHKSAHDVSCLPVVAFPQGSSSTGEPWQALLGCPAELTSRSDYLDNPKQYLQSWPVVAQICAGPLAAHSSLSDM